MSIHWGQITPKGCVGVQREYSAICWDAEGNTEGRVQSRGSAVNNCQQLDAKFQDSGVAVPKEVSGTPSNSDWKGDSRIWGVWYVNDPACGYIAPTIPPAPTVPPAPTAPAPPAPAEKPAETPAGTPAPTSTEKTPTDGKTDTSKTTNSEKPAEKTQEGDNTWIYILIGSIVLIFIIIIIIVVVVSSRKSSRPQQGYYTPPPEQQYYQ